MATYKVIQDIEAEDKLLGPLSFRQFIYFLIASFLAFLSFTAITQGVWPLLIFLLPPMFFCLFFAWPWSPDQPTEVWALARIRYYFKPRKRLWNQSGVKEFVTITVPKKIERHFTDGLSQDQVRSRLEALSQTIDSRGWAIKNANTYTSKFDVAADDRLVGYETVSHEVSDIRDSDDILDEFNNPVAGNMQQLIQTSSTAHRKELLQRMDSMLHPNGQQAAPQSAQWFQRQQNPGQSYADIPASQVAAGVLPTVPSPQVMQQTAAPIAAPLPAQPTIPDAAAMQQQQPMPAPAPPVAPAAPPQQPVIATKSGSDAAILNLAHDNNLDVATLSREAKRARDDNGGEVTISLR